MVLFSLYLLVVKDTTSRSNYYRRETITSLEQCKTLGRYKQLGETDQHSKMELEEGVLHLHWESERVYKIIFWKAYPDDFIAVANFLRIQSRVTLNNLNGCFTIVVSSH